MAQKYDILRERFCEYIYIYHFQLRSLSPQDPNKDVTYSTIGDAPVSDAVSFKEIIISFAVLIVPLQYIENDLALPEASSRWNNIQHCGSTLTATLRITQEQKAFLGLLHMI